MLRFVPLACLLLPFSAAAQTPPSANSKAQANAEAKANSSDSKSNKSSSSQTVTHRVVVENGKTIVDERIVDNKPAKGGRLPIAPGMDPEEMMRKMREQLEREMGGLPISLPGSLPGRMSKNVRSTSNSSSAKSSDQQTVKDRSSNRSSPASKSQGASPAKSPAKTPATPPTKPRGTLVPRSRKTDSASHPIR